MDLKAHIRDIPDFPQPGILFRDITPLLGEPAAFRAVLDTMEREARERDAAAIVGIESRGFVFGAPLAERLGLPFVPVRKPGKLPAKTVLQAYDLEYGTDRVEMHADAVEKGERVLIVDDVIATGGTALATARLVESLGGEVVGFGFIIELTFLPGRAKLAGYQVESLIRY